MIENRHHFETTAKCAYIDRANYKDLTENQVYNFNWMNEKKQDLVYTETILPDGAPEEFKNMEILCASIEQCEANSRFDSLIARDFIVNLSNDLVIRDSVGYIDRQAIQQFIKDDLDSFFRDNFKDYIVHYAVHMNSKELNSGDDVNDNFHIHFIVFANRYDVSEKKWLKKTYRDERTGKYIYYNDLDDRKRCYSKLDSIRKNMSELQNRKLKELGLEENVQYLSFRKRNTDKMYVYRLSRFHYNELLKLKQKYAYLDNDIEIYNAIMKERNNGATLTKKQRHNLYAELIYNSTDKIQSKDEMINKAFQMSFDNKALGYRAKATLSKTGNTTLREISKSVRAIHQAEINEQYKRGR